MALLWLWDWSGSGAVTDLSGNGRGFALTGTSARTAAGGGYTYGGARPNAIGLSQGAAEIQVGPSLTGLQTTSRTMAGWVKIAGAYTGHFMEFYRNPTDDTGVWTWLYLSSVFRGRAKNAVGGTFERTVTPSTSYRFIAMTHDGANLKVYQSDGAGTVAQVGADVAMASAVWTADVFRIFDQAGSGVVLGPWEGYDTALSLAQLQSIASTPPDARGAAAPGIALETDTAQGAGRVRATGGGAAAETDTAQGAGRVRSTAAGVALEADTARPAASPSGATAGQAAETDAARPAGRVRTTAAGVALEADTALSAARTRATTPGAASETDTARSAGVARSTAAGVALEVDQAFAATDPNAILRDLLITGDLEPDRWGRELDPDRWAHTLETNRWLMEVEPR